MQSSASLVDVVSDAGSHFSPEEDQSMDLLPDHVQSNLRYVAALALVLRANYISVLRRNVSCCSLSENSEPDFWLNGWSGTRQLFQYLLTDLMRLRRTNITFDRHRYATKSPDDSTTIVATGRRRCVWVL
jgi:hypothetical protein